MNEPSAWKQPLIWGSVLGVLTLGNSIVSVLGGLISYEVAQAVALLTSLAGIGLFVVGAPVAAVMAVRGRCKELVSFSRYALTNGEGAGVGAKTGLVTTGWLVAGVMASFMLGAALGAPSAPGGVGAGELANVVGAGFAASACTAFCYGCLYALFGAGGGFLGALIFAKNR